MTHKLNSLEFSQFRFQSSNFDFYSQMVNFVFFSSILQNQKLFIILNFKTEILLLKNEVVKIKDLRTNIFTFTS